ncbi:MAG: hypothetical protein QOI58_3319 [Thermoanaerobaculia bacterium]|jgi:predicted AlkP superfamily pyrophosphatase or phosphodiesterase|nr:hypothetical protein [Thermoanaerobaculia bacterium]
MRAVDYLHEISAALDHGYPADCVTHACRLTELLLLEGKKPWIARLRDVREVASGVFHGPLTPIRLAGRKGPTWTTHYVACEGDLVYDPLTEAPIAIDGYSVAAFGREIPLERFLDEATTAELSGGNELRAALR